jgi:hypothetical protein
VIFTRIATMRIARGLGSTSANIADYLAAQPGRQVWYSTSGMAHTPLTALGAAALATCNAPRLPNAPPYGAPQLDPGCQGLEDLLGSEESVPVGQHAHQEWVVVGHGRSPRVEEGGVRRLLKCKSNERLLQAPGWPGDVLGGGMPRSARSACIAVLWPGRI